MDTRLLFELIGYAASVLIAISLTMRSVLRLRIINLVGALLFTIYGLVIRAYPVAAVNFVIVLIDLYYLAEMLRAKEYFSLLQVQPDSEYLRYFLQYHHQEIQRFLPGFDYHPGAGTLVFFILRNMIPAGLLIGREVDEGCLQVSLDFVIPGYRDFKTGSYIYRQQSEFFTSRGIRKVVSPPGSSQHEAYLRRMGFHLEQDPAGKHYALVIQ